MQVITPYGLACSSVKLGLTFASLRSLKPAVLCIFFAHISTILVPSAARSAATVTPGFLECAALTTYYIFWGDA